MDASRNQNGAWVDAGGGRLEAFRDARDWRVGQLQIINSNPVVQGPSLFALLDPIPDASYTRNRKRSPPNSRCFPGTRENLIKKVNSWIDSSPLADNPHVMWIHGFTGCGKSAIAQVVAERIARQHRLAASLFFFRGSGERSTVARFATTIASHVAAAIPATAPIIRAAIDANPGLTSISATELTAQFQHLVYDPIDAVGRDASVSPFRHGPFLIVLDGLDECEDQNEIEAFIEHMLEYFNDNPGIPLRFLITSRVEAHLHQLLHSSNQVKALDLVQHTSDEDISAALDVAIAKEKAHRVLVCDPSWPSPGEMGCLVRHIGRSYIFMTTIIKLLFHPPHTDGLTPMDRLPLALGTSPNFDGLYRAILLPWKNLPHFRDVLSTVTLAEMPLSITQVADVLEIRTVDVVSVLVNLHAIMQIPGDDHQPVTLWHTSLRDFLSSKDRAGPLFLSPVYHLRLAFRCATASNRSDDNSQGTSWLDYARRFSSNHLLRSAGGTTGGTSCVFDGELGSIARRLNDPVFDGKTALEVAASAENWALVQCLVNARVDVNTRFVENKWGNIVTLHAVCRSWKDDMIVFLLKRGANPNISDAHGDTPLHSACRRGHVEVVELLLVHGSDTSVRNNLGDTPLHDACYYGYVDVAEVLLNRHADHSAKNSHGATPLHRASFYGNEEVVELLLNHDADPSVQNNLGDTPLHDACYYGYAEVAELLLEYGADPTIANNSGATPLHDAYCKSHDAVVQLLLDYGADPSIKDKRGKTAPELKQEIAWTSSQKDTELLSLSHAIRRLPLPSRDGGQGAKSGRGRERLAYGFPSVPK